MVEGSAGNETNCWVGLVPSGGLVSVGTANSHHDGEQYLEPDQVIFESVAQRQLGLYNNRTAA